MLWRTVTRTIRTRYGSASRAPCPTVPSRGMQPTGTPSSSRLLRRSSPAMPECRDGTPGATRRDRSKWHGRRLDSPALAAHEVGHHGVALDCSRNGADELIDRRGAREFLTLAVDHPPTGAEHVRRTQQAMTAVQQPGLG